MNKTEIDHRMQTTDPQSMIPLLEAELEEEYDEYIMLCLVKCLMAADNDKKAKKILRRLKNLYPSGIYYEEEEALAKALNSDVKGVPDVSSKVCGSREMSLTGIFSGGKRKQKEVPENIRAYFTDTVGLTGIQEDLDRFYKLLRFQKERKQNDFQATLLKSTNFVISGARGSGKTHIARIIGRMLSDFDIRQEATPVNINFREVFSAYAADVKNGISSLLSGHESMCVVLEDLQDILDSPDVDRKDFLACLEKNVRDNSAQCSYIVTGTPEALQRMKMQNSTMEDCFHAFLEIPPYNTLELLQILEKIARGRALKIHESSRRILIKKIDTDRKSADFMNAITLGRYLDEAALRMAERFFSEGKATEAAMVYLMPEDFSLETEDDSIEELLGQLNALTGLKNVKEQIRKRILTLNADRLAEEAGAQRQGGQGTLHMLFTGNPGTGKTTIARMIGKMYQQLGILPRGNIVVECTRGNLVGQYQGHSAKNVQEKFREAAGGVLFIDEAYSLCRDDHDSFGHETVDELVAQMENNKDSMMVILAGYRKEMEDFLKSNSGLSSRIRNHIDFEDYSIDEMCEIFHFLCKTNGMELCQEAEVSDALRLLIEARSKIPDFGNARGVRNLFDEVREAQNERLMKLSLKGTALSKDEYDRITKEDLQTAAGRKTKGDLSLEDLLAEINGLTGLTGAKRKVQEMVDAIQVRKMMKERGMETDEGTGTLHLIFKGNAGTGKTTVARLLGQIYKKLGVLKKNVFIEVSRGDLVAGYVGQTASRVLAKIEEADGGILFIDEAYTLINGSNDEFGREAVQTLVAELENRRNSLMVIVAGYGEDMDEFLNANQGLASRLSNEIVFEDYNLDELKEIFIHMADEKKLRLEENCETGLREWIAEERKKQKDFGNARGVRNLLDQCIRRKNSRIAALYREGKEVSNLELITIRKEDMGWNNC